MIKTSKSPKHIAIILNFSTWYLTARPMTLMTVILIDIVMTGVSLLFFAKLKGLLSFFCYFC